MDVVASASQGVSLHISHATGNDPSVPVLTLKIRHGLVYSLKRGDEIPFDSDAPVTVRLTETHLRIENEIEQGSAIPDDDSGNGQDVCGRNLHAVSEHEPDWRA